MDKTIWQERMNNLIERRKTYSRSSPTNLPTYEEMLKNFSLTNPILDVGCGDRNILNIIARHGFLCDYTGIDPFPISEEVLKAEIETFETARRFGTIIAFAVLDGVYDLGKAIMNIKRLCFRNVIILTGIDIEPDKYHTFKISEDFLHKNFSPFTMTFKNYLAPKLLLCEFST